MSIVYAKLAVLNSTIILVAVNLFCLLGPKSTEKCKTKIYVNANPFYDLRNNKKKLKRKAKTEQTRIVHGDKVQ